MCQEITFPEEQATMPHRTPIMKVEQQDPLKEYVTSVHGLHRKLAQINANQQDVAASLGRAAAALRSIAALNKPRSTLEIRK